VLAIHKHAAEDLICAKIAEHRSVATDYGRIDKISGIAPLIFEIEIGSTRCDGEMTTLSLQTLNRFKVASDGRAVLAEKRTVEVCYYQNVTEICHYLEFLSENFN
jgi:hypothetical protein